MAFPNAYYGGSLGNGGPFQRQTPMMQTPSNRPVNFQNMSSSMAPNTEPGIYRGPALGPQGGPQTIADPRLVGPSAPGPKMSTPYTTPTPLSQNGPNTWAQWQQNFANLFANQAPQWNMPQPGSDAPMVNQYMPMNPNFGPAGFNPTQNAWGQKPMSPFSGSFGPQRAF